MNQQLQTKAMALLTALLQGASPAERKDMLDCLWKKNLRQFIYKNIIHSAAPMGDEMAHHLYVLQALTLGLLEPRMRTPLDPYSQEQREQLQALRQAAFEPDGESLGTGLSADRRRSLCVREFRKLGFSNSNPAQDLERVPPGLLALDNMLYFSRHAPSAYSRVSNRLGQGDGAAAQLHQGLHGDPVTILYSHCLSSCWRTVAERTSMNAPLPGAAFS